MFVVQGWLHDEYERLGILSRQVQQKGHATNPSEPIRSSDPRLAIVIDVATGSFSQAPREEDHASEAPTNDTDSADDDDENEACSERKRMTADDAEEETCSKKKKRKKDKECADDEAASQGVKKILESFADATGRSAGGHMLSLEEWGYFERAAEDERKSMVTKAREEIEAKSWGGEWDGEGVLKSLSGTPFKRQQVFRWKGSGGSSYFFKRLMRWTQHAVANQGKPAACIQVRYRFGQNKVLAWALTDEGLLAASRLVEFCRVNTIITRRAAEISKELAKQDDIMTIVQDLNGFLGGFVQSELYTPSQRGCLWQTLISLVDLDPTSPRLRDDVQEVENKFRDFVKSVKARELIPGQGGKQTEGTENQWVGEDLDLKCLNWHLRTGLYHAYLNQMRAGQSEA